MDYTMIISLITGLVCGLIFLAFKLPLPAPPVFAGVAGIIGIWLAQPLWSVITKFIS